MYETMRQMTPKGGRVDAGGETRRTFCSLTLRSFPRELGSIEAKFLRLYLLVQQMVRPQEPAFSGTKQTQFTGLTWDQEASVRGVECRRGRSRNMRVAVVCDHPQGGWIEDQLEPPADDLGPECRSLWGEVVVIDMPVVQEAPLGHSAFVLGQFHQSQVLVHEFVQGIAVASGKDPVNVADPSGVDVIPAHGLHLEVD